MGRVRSCRVCGCTDERACRGGCYWIGPDLCSRCEDDRGAIFRGVCQETRPIGTTFNGVVLDVLRHGTFEILIFETEGPPKQAFLCMHSPGMLAGIIPGDLGSVVLKMGPKGTYWKYNGQAEACLTDQPDTLTVAESRP